jgi:hypothetical protein
MPRPDAKPLDAGTGRICASFDANTAAWLSIGAPHAEHGFAELSALPAFDEGLRGDPAATRRHRLEMTDGRHAFLSVELDGALPELRADPSDARCPRWRAGGTEVEVSAEVDAEHVRQTWRIARRGGPAPAVRLRLRGRLDRPALAEITELDPPTPTGATTRRQPGTDGVVIESPELRATFTVRVAGASVAWAPDGDALAGTLSWPGTADALRFVVEVGTPGHPRVEAGSSVRPRAYGAIVDRALAYVRGCTALRVAADERTILTDHRILPLSWTRDAYWQALALLVADDIGDRQRVADHLRWLWRRCERPDRRWVRSHHANGRRKDLAFQADQQLYPMLELADYWRLTGSLPDGVDWTSEVDWAWQAALAGADPATGFVASAENAADDPAPAPFIISSQILLWYTARRLQELTAAGALVRRAPSFDATAAAIDASFETHVAAGSTPWPYAVDGAGVRIAYHDANDLPVALAPLWGFRAGDDAGWRATMEFAFSAANPGWFEGPRGGLGSAHTPGPWTLGDVQAWIVARVTGDDLSASATLARLHEAAFADGMLPEAYTASGSLERVRHWFAWPGAALAALRLLDADRRGGGLRRLRASR